MGGKGVGAQKGQDGIVSTSMERKKKKRRLRKGSGYVWVKVQRMDFLGDIDTMLR